MYSLFWISGFSILCLYVCLYFSAFHILPYTNLSLSSCALLNHSARHWAADGKTLEKSSHCVTQTQGDQFLDPEKHTIYSQVINLKANRSSLILSITFLPGCCPHCIHISRQRFVPVRWRCRSQPQTEQRHHRSPDQAERYLVQQAPEDWKMWTE